MDERFNPPEKIQRILGRIEKLPMLPAVAVRLLEGALPSILPD